MIVDYLSNEPGLNEIFDESCVTIETLHKFAVSIKMLPGE